MKYSEGDEWALLESLETEDKGDGLNFGYVGEFEFAQGIQTEDGAHPCDAAMRYLITQMESRGYVERRWETLSGFNLVLRPAGHDRLNWHRENTIFRRVARWCGRWVDRALASIVTPIIVSILTVLALRYLGLSK